MLFPNTRKGFFELSKNLADHLTADTNGQFRQGRNWVGARIAKSLPDQSKDFNVNTLLDALAAEEAKGGDAPLSVRDWANAYEGSLIELMDVIPTLLARETKKAQGLISNEYNKQVKVIFDDVDMDGFNYQVLLPTDNENDFYIEDGWKLLTSFETHEEALAAALVQVKNSEHEAKVAEVTHDQQDALWEKAISAIESLGDNTGHILVNGAPCTSFYIPTIPSKEEFSEQPDNFEDFYLDFTIGSKEIYIDLGDILFSAVAHEDGSIVVKSGGKTTTLKPVVYQNSALISEVSDGAITEDFHSTSEAPNVCRCYESNEPHAHCMTCDCILGTIGDSDTECKSCIYLRESE